MYCNILYSFSKSARSYFFDNIVRAIEIGVDQLAAGGSKHAALDAPTRILLMVMNRFTIQERAF